MVLVVRAVNVLTIPATVDPCISAIALSADSWGRSRREGDGGTNTAIAHLVRKFCGVFAGARRASERTLLNICLTTMAHALWCLALLTDRWIAHDHTETLVRCQD